MPFAAVLRRKPIDLASRGQIQCVSQRAQAKLKRRRTSLFCVVTIRRMQDAFSILLGAIGMTCTAWLNHAGSSLLAFGTFRRVVRRRRVPLLGGTPVMEQKGRGVLPVRIELTTSLFITLTLSRPLQAALVRWTVPSS